MRNLLIINSYGEVELSMGMNGGNESGLQSQVKARVKGRVNGIGVGKFKKD